MKAYILAGGKSSRMGEDKGLKRLKGKPLVEYVLEAAKPWAEEICIIGSREEYGVFGYRLLPDIFPDKGPMGGLYTALSHSQSPVLLLGCDMPFLSAPFLGYLRAQAWEGACIPSVQGRLQPLCALYHPNALPLIRSSIEAGNLKMTGLIAALPHRLIIPPSSFPPSLFNNLNTPQDFEEAEKML